MFLSAVEIANCLPNTSLLHSYWQKVSVQNSSMPNQTVPVTFVLAPVMWYSSVQWEVSWSHSWHEWFFFLLETDLQGQKWEEGGQQLTNSCRATSLHSSMEHHSLAVCGMMVPWICNAETLQRKQCASSLSPGGVREGSLSYTTSGRLTLFNKALYSCSLLCFMSPGSKYLRLSLFR